MSGYLAFSCDRTCRPAFELAFCFGAPGISRETNELRRVLLQSQDTISFTVVDSIPAPAFHEISTIAAVSASGASVVIQIGMIPGKISNCEETPSDYYDDAAATGYRYRTRHRLARDPVSASPGLH